MLSSTQTPLQENPSSDSSSSVSSSEEEEEEITPRKLSSSTIPIPNSNSIKTSTSVTQSLALSNAAKSNDDGEDDSTSTDDDESGSDSSDDSAQNIRPISSKPMTETQKPKKPDNSVVGKRSLETDGDDKDSRKEKKMKKVEEANEKKSRGGDHSNSKKLWTEQDEIDILKGMIDFNKTKGDPDAEVGAFFNFLKYDHLRSDVTKQQLRSKIRTLKRKYINTLKKRAKQPGKISKPHEAHVFKLSRKVWAGEVTKTEDVGVACENPYLKQSFVVGNNSMLPVVPPVLGHFFSMSNTRLDLIESCNANELNNKWKNVMIAETEAYLDRLELVKEQTKMMLDKLKSSN